jgi:putative hydroxymethylpyrimidine transport system substrate-binding protein
MLARRMPRPIKPLAALVALAAVALSAALLAGCGSTGTTRTGTGDSAGAQRTQSASLVLDFTPNAIHSGIYTALAKGYLRQAGVKLKVDVPGASTDAISLLVNHRVNFAILDIHDLAIADAQHQHLVGIMAIVERPLASVIAQPQYASPKDLDGQTIGVTGDPSDLAVLHSIVQGAGGTPGTLKTVTIGYNAVPDLIAGRVAAATAFWNDEGVQIAKEKPGYHVFRVEDFGAPAYPELVLTATASELKADPKLASDLVHGLVRGYQSVIADPAAAAQALEAQTTGLVPAQVSEQLAGEIPAFTPKGGGAVGALEPALLRQWAAWELKFKIVKRLPDIATMFTQRFLPQA